IDDRRATDHYSHRAIDRDTETTYTLLWGASPGSPHNPGCPFMTRDHRPLPSTTVLLILIILGLVIGIGLGIVARGANVLAWDVEVTSAFQNAQGPVVDNVAEVGHKLGSTLAASIGIGIALLLALLLRARRE